MGSGGSRCGESSGVQLGARGGGGPPGGFPQVFVGLSSGPGSGHYRESPDGGGCFPDSGSGGRPCGGNARGRPHAPGHQRDLPSGLGVGSVASRKSPAPYRASPGGTHSGYLRCRRGGRRRARTRESLESRYRGGASLRPEAIRGACAAGCGRRVSAAGRPDPGCRSRRAGPRESPDDSGRSPFRRAGPCESSDTSRRRRRTRRAPPCESPCESSGASHPCESSGASRRGAPPGLSGWALGEGGGGWRASLGGGSVHGSGSGRARLDPPRSDPAPAGRPSRAPSPRRGSGLGGGRGGENGRALGSGSRRR